MATRAASRLEKQMGALLEKIDRQRKQLEDLVKWQTERMDRLAQNQVETEEHVSAVEGDLNSAVDGWNCWKQEHLRKKLCHELLRDLSAPTELLEGGLSLTALPFVPRAVLEDNTMQLAG